MPPAPLPQNPVVEEIQNTTGVNPSQINGYFGGYFGKWK